MVLLCWFLQVSRIIADTVCVCGPQWSGPCSQSSCVWVARKSLQPISYSGCTLHHAPRFCFVFFLPPQPVCGLCRALINPGNAPLRIWLKPVRSWIRYTCPSVPLCLRLFVCAWLTAASNQALMRLLVPRWLLGWRHHLIQRVNGPVYLLKNSARANVPPSSSFPPITSHSGYCFSGMAAFLYSSGASKVQRLTQLSLSLPLFFAENIHCSALNSSSSPHSKSILGSTAFLSCWIWDRVCFSSVFFKNMHIRLMRNSKYPLSEFDGSCEA